MVVFCTHNGLLRNDLFGTISASMDWLGRREVLAEVELRYVFYVFYVCKCVFKKPVVFWKCW